MRSIHAQILKQSGMREAADECDATDDSAEFNANAPPDVLAILSDGVCYGQGCSMAVVARECCSRWRVHSYKLPETP